MWKVSKISGGRLSRPLALFDFQCLIVVFILFPVEASEGIFVMSGVIWVEVILICWGGAARLVLKYSCYLVSWSRRVASNRPAASLMPVWLHVKGFPASRFVIW